jgi:hypothetical protein
MLLMIACWLRRLSSSCSVSSSSAAGWRLAAAACRADREADAVEDQRLQNSLRRVGTPQQRMASALAYAL